MLTNLARYIGRNHLGLLALFVALGGTGYATVVNVPRASVGTPELKRNAVKAAKIAPNAVRTGHVLDGSLVTADFKPGQIPQGPRGDKGERGEKGEKGDPGATSVVVRTGQGPNLAQGSGTFLKLVCEVGERAVGGGAGFVSGDAISIAVNGDDVQQSFPLEADQSPPEAGDTTAGWFVSVRNNSATPRAPTGYVVCARP